ncbi:MAG: magnesium/cobalt transporter CorA [Phycisphaeraceae bacterium]|nr:magnesium/cobalt transporter CorA [Phycisphaeraceae bacterium]
MARHHSHRKSRRVRPPLGSPPGTLRIDPEAPPPVIDIICYGPDSTKARPVQQVEELAKLDKSWPVTWINVCGLGDEVTVRRIGEIFKLHALAMADVVNVTQRPKVEPYSEHLFTVMRLVSLEDQRVNAEQISLFLVGNVVITFQERRGDCFEPVRQRIRAASGRIRGQKADYLAYALIDAMIDAYYPVLEQLGDRIDGLEDQVMMLPDHQTLAQVRQVRRDLLRLRRSLWPTRDAVSALLRDPLPQISESTRLYLRDCYDHVSQLIDNTEMLRELASGLQEVYLSTLSNRINSTMRMLTTVATIFIPLTFIVGIYGMNFDPEISPWNMPELGWYWGYPLIMGLMLALTLFMLYVFWRKGLLGTPSRNRGDDPADVDTAAEDQGVR